jgi:hypothetical protein
MKGISGVSLVALLAATLLSTGGKVGAAHNQAKPQVNNAKVEVRDAKAALAQEVEAWAKASQQPRWLGYAVAAAERDRQACCNSYGSWNDKTCGTCRLEDGDHGTSINLRGNDIKLEGPNDLVVLLRAANGKVGKIRMVSEDCVLDAGGLQFTWLNNVNPVESVRFLVSFVDPKQLDERGQDRLSRGALTAIALHGDTSADQALVQFTSSDKPEGMRREAAFWAGEARGASGVQLLKRMAKEDPSSEVRAQVAFALSVSREGNAVDEMIRMAHEDSSAHVRGQALFWLAQKAGHKAVSTITGAIENDPDTEVKKKAVFALSQMPKDEGVPKLIQIAQNNRNPEVRRQAMFWLGQSNDPRALEFFEKVLSK